MPISNRTVQNTKSQDKLNRIRQRRKENGICTKCGTRKPEEGGTTCEVCREKSRRRKNKYREWNRKAGLCIECGKTKEKLNNARYCDSCRAVLRRASSRLHARRVSAGVCTRCGIEKANVGSNQCKDCIEKIAVDGLRRRLIPENKRRLKSKQLEKLYDISLDEYEELAAEQNHVCAICYKPSLNGKLLHVDHHHGTGRIRGLLCHNCNVSIGGLQDSPELLRRAADYIEKYE